MLRRLGYDVPATVGTGDLAIQTALKNQPDLILMDIQLRGNMDGVQAATAITEQMDVPIVYLTANSDGPTLQRAKETGPYGFLVKPFEERAIQAGIEMAIYKHQSEKRSHEREQWLSTTLTSIADGVITTDENGITTFVNKTAEEILGRLCHETQNRHYSEYFRLLDHSTQLPPPDFVAEALTQGFSRVCESQTMLVTGDNGAKPIALSTAPIRYSRDRIGGCVIVFRDISEQQKLEEELRQSQKMDAIGKLAGSIAHDFNNAITAVMGYSSLLLSRLPEANALREDAGHILRAAEYSARLTRQLLAFSRKQIIQPVELNLGKTIQEMQGVVRRLIREDIRMNFVIDADDCWIKADPGHLEQLVFNMAINARDAMPNGGSLTFRVGTSLLSPGTARTMSDAQAGEYVMLEIIDTGTGMSAETQQRIFEPFFTTKGPDKGTGLGLSTCQNIVQRANGFIDLFSVLGAGTTFSIYFPKIAGQTATAPEHVAPQAGALAGAETILLVEDEEVVRLLASSVLTEAGYTVLEAGNGQEALAALTESGRTFDLMLTDMVMPRLGGRDLAEHIFSNGLDIRVLFMSGYTDDDVLRDAVFDSKVEFLQKPFTPNHLLQKVAEVLEPRRRSKIEPSSRAA
jgi:PAS domain S-box-containing protein